LEKLFVLIVVEPVHIKGEGVSKEVSSGFSRKSGVIETGGESEHICFIGCTLSV
jgi:hypothetical protein